MRLQLEQNYSLTKKGGEDISYYRRVTIKTLKIHAFIFFICTYFKLVVI